MKLAFDLPTSMHQHVAGQTLDHYPSDTVEAETYTKDIKYRFNAQGFRCEHDLTTLGRDTNIYLGCSNTLGIGVNLHETWCQHVNDSVGGTMCNLGQAGGAHETAYRLARHWIAVIKPRRVFMLSPPSVRREFWIDHDTPTIIGPRSTMPGHMMSDREIQINCERVVDAIQYHCVTHGAEFKYVYFHSIYKDWDKEMPDLGRDGTHPGPKTHKMIAEHFK